LVIFVSDSEYKNLQAHSLFRVADVFISFPLSLVRAKKHQNQNHTLVAVPRIRVSSPQIVLFIPKPVVKKNKQAHWASLV
jgi:hypothetical protein